MRNEEGRVGEGEQEEVEKKRERRDKGMLIEIWVVKTVSMMVEMGTRTLPGIWLNHICVAF